jgi:hypothetical protein
MKKVDLQNYLLLGKQTILIARFSDDEFNLAGKEYGAQVRETPETAYLIQLCFQRTAFFFAE